MAEVAAWKMHGGPGEWLAVRHCHRYTALHDDAP